MTLTSHRRPQAVWQLVLAFLISASWFDTTSALITSDISVRQWTLNNSNRSLSLPTTLPAYPLEVLRASNIIRFDPLYSYGESLYRWVADETWTFSTTFNSNDPDIAPALASIAVQLRFYGLDTFATVQLNGKEVLGANNFHRRWFVPVKQHLVQGLNTLSITIRPATAESVTLRNTHGNYWPLWPADRSVGAFNMARKPHSDFGWDWGPAFSPSGIHGGVELAGYDNAFIQASSMTQKKVDSTFKVTVVLDMQVPAAEAGTAVASFDSLGISVSQPVSFAEPGLKQVSLQLSVPESLITCWWPVGFGPQQLYNLRVTYTPSAPSIKCVAGNAYQGLSAAEFAAAGAAELDASLDQKRKDYLQAAASCIMAAQSVLTRRVGFRTVELVRQAPSAAVKELLPPGESGWGSSPGNGETFYIKVNGWPIFAKGSNMVPLRVLHSSMTKGMITDVVQHALGANMNMIRVWGGGHYQVEEFYDLADQYGMMVWVESIFACAHYPTAQEFLSNVAAETTQQAQRLSWHTSVVMWSGNNEVEQSLDWFQQTRDNRQYYKDAYVALFVDTIRPIVRKVAPHVPYVDGSPNKGVYADNDQSYSKRWGDTNDGSRGDLHFYTYNCDCKDCENPNVYPKARFVSEFGVQSYPTLETLGPALGAADSYVDSGNMRWRQRKFSDAPSSVFDWAGLHFRLASNWNAGDEANKKRLLQSFLFIAQMQQGRCYQSALSYWRRLRANPEALTMGVLYWQLNDVAPFASWSGFDSGGRWKPLGYFVQRTFAPLAVHVLEAWGKVEVWVLNDLPTPLQFTITVRLLSLNKAYPNATASGCAAELKPAKVLDVKAPQNFAKWVWAINVGDLLKLQPGCTRTTCYVHASTTVGPAAAAEQGHSDSAAPAPPQGTAAADVRVSVAEPEAPVAFWPTEGVSALPHKKAAAGSLSQTADGAAGAKLAPGSVPDVQLLLADPRNINFLDPKLQISSPTASGSRGGLSVTLTATTAASHVLLTSQNSGYFSDNALMVLHPCLPQTITFNPASSLQQQPTPAAFLSGLRVESLYNHQFGSAAQEVDAMMPRAQGPDGATGQQTPVQGSSRVFQGTPLAPISANNSVADTAAAAAPSAAL